MNWVRCRTDRSALASETASSTCPDSAKRTTRLAVSSVAIERGNGRTPRQGRICLAMGSAQLGGMERAARTAWSCTIGSCTAPPSFRRDAKSLATSPGFFAECLARCTDWARQAVTRCSPRVGGGGM